MGFFAHLALLPDLMASQFRLDLYCTYHQSAGHHIDRCTALQHAIHDIVVFLSMCFCLYYYYYCCCCCCFISCILYIVILSNIMCCFVLSFVCVSFRVLESLSTMSGSRAKINGMMVMIQSTLRLDFFS